MMLGATAGAAGSLHASPHASANTCVNIGALTETAGDAATATATD